MFILNYQQGTYTNSAIDVSVKLILFLLQKKVSHI